MYRKSQRQQLEFADFYLPFSGKLRADNRWVKLAQLVPWEIADSIYADSFCDDFGAPALPSRLALGALVIKEFEGLTDRGTVEAIQENPYMQFFVGLEEFSDEPAFDPSLMVDFRKRFGETGMAIVNEAVALNNSGAAVVRKGTGAIDDSKSANDSGSDDEPPASDRPVAESSAESEATNSSRTNSPTEYSAVDESDCNTCNNQGQLLIDATCAPADIRYPTDVSLLNEAREKTDEMIDVLHRPLIGKSKRCRTYRQKAAREFAAFIRRKKPNRKTVRKAVRKQLGYLRRNLAYIEQLVHCPAAAPLPVLGRRLYKLLLVCHEVYRQQKQMFDTKTRRVDDRIVSLSQPHVRPMMRGKASANTEFGAKLSASVVAGFCFLDHLSWDSFNESGDLVTQIEAYRERYGFYPESVHVDQIYRTRRNRAYCKDRGIRMSGPPLGRPRQSITLAEKKQSREDEVIRNAVEGKFGQAKRRFSLSRIMTKLATTSAAQIGLTFLVMNLEAALKRLLLVVTTLLTAAAHSPASITACTSQQDHPRNRHVQPHPRYQRWRK